MQPPIPRRDRRAGFTLVELLIVVVILAILAAIVIPTFQNSSAEAKESALAGNLATVRQAISLYRVQHNEVYPGQGGWSEFVTQLTNATNPDGTTSGSPTQGPYLRGSDFPRNPVNGLNTGTNVTSLPGAPTGTYGYVYVTTTGELRADVVGAAPSGIDYWDL